MTLQDKRVLRLTIGLLLMIGLGGGLAACNLPTRRAIDGERATLAPTPALPVSGVPTIEPTLATLQLAVHPPETRTERQDLDDIIHAVLAHDVQRLRSLTAFTTLGCTHAQALGGPPVCEEGEAEGSLVEVVPFIGPEGHHMRRAAYEVWPGLEVRGLLAVYEVSAQAYSENAYPAGEYGILFLDADGETVITLNVREGRVVRFDYRFGGSIEADVSRNAGEMILPLSFNPIPTTEPWSRFEDPLGRFAFVYPPTFMLTESPEKQFWWVGNQVEVFILPPGASYVACFDQALGDCPIVEQDQMVEINGVEARRVKGWFGAVGGYIPQEFLTYIFNLVDEQLVMTVYALPFDTQLQEITQVWPLEGMALELFEMMVATVTIREGELE